MRTAIELATVALFSFLLSLLFNYIHIDQNSSIKAEFKSWAQKFGKEYISESQFVYRFEVYQRNKQKVQAHNKLAEQGKSKYFMGLNEFADLTQLQFKYSFGKLQYGENIVSITTKCAGAIADTPNPPDQLNWTEKAVDKTVKTEGKCAANWAFSAVGAVEGLYALKSGNLIKLSDQQVIDCSGDYGNEGCGGGFMEQAFWYIVDSGMASEKSYPYVGQNQKCVYSQSQKVAKVGKCAKVPAKSYQKLLSAVVQQPVSVSIASQKFMLYERGIFDGECTTDIDRGMLLVGYGIQNEVNFWILKNFLGVAWGQRGYLRLKREIEDGAGMCGIQLAASVPQNVQ